MNRYADADTAPSREESVPLPEVNWQAVGRQAPRPLKVGHGGPNASLPKADVVVMTWTTAEWCALDHVFLNSSTSSSPSSRTFEAAWLPYTKGAPKSPKSPTSAEYTPPPLWGSYQLVSIDDRDGTPQTVLLFKSNAHLAYSPWIGALEEMVGRIIEDAQPDRFYSIGTAGGTSLQQNLGDTAITNSATISLKAKQNETVSYNHKTFTSPWYPSFDLVPAVQDKLLFRLDSVLTRTELETLLTELHEKDPAAKAFGLGDLVNAPITPSNLGSPKAIEAKEVPLLTTDFYFIATGDDSEQYCVLEMDDAVVAKVAGDKDVQYCFVRNISDPIVPSKSQKKLTIPANVRSDWSGGIYKACGVYSSFNGALLAWATIAGHSVQQAAHQTGEIGTTADIGKSEQ